MKHFAIYLMAMLVILTGCRKKQPTPAEQPDTLIEAEARKPAAVLEGLNWIKGKGDPVTLTDGKIYVVEFWATWCPPCRTSIPHLTEIQKTFKDKGVTVIGITNEGPDTVKPFVEKMGDEMEYTVAIDTDSKANTGYMEAYGQNGIPTAFVVDGDGKVAWVGHPMGGLDAALATLTGTDLPEKPVEVKAQEEPATPKAQIGQAAASLDGLTFIKGEPVSIEDGKIYVVEFWATWCPPCRTSIPHLTELQNKLKDKGVTVIGISNEDDTEKVKDFVAEQGEKMGYTVALDPDKKVNNGYMNAFGQGGIPTAFIVDTAGKVVWVGHPMSDLEMVLETVVKGEFDAVAYAKEKAQREQAEHRLGRLYQEYFGAVENGSSIKQSRPIAEKIISDGHAGILNAFAWSILYTLPEDKRDLETALKAAEKANTEANGENPMILDTYALALFQNDKIEEAVAIQDKAVTMVAENENTQAELQARLDRYKAALDEPVQQ